MNQAVAVEQRTRAAQPAAVARLIALVLPLALLAGAYGSQYLGGLQPCEMCWWQRYAHMGALAFAILAFVRSDAQWVRWTTLLAALAIALSGGIAVYHAGVEAKVFEGFTTCTALPTKGLSTAELLKTLTHAPLVRCDEVQFRFLGISMAGWNAIISLSGAGTILYLLWKARKA